MRVVKLRRVWTLGPRIGDQSGFGQVFEATADDDSIGVVKLVPKTPGAERELLFEDLKSVRNVVPIIESGEFDNYWVLVMPRAERSLRAYLDACGGALSVESALPILSDIAVTLADLDGRVVHRDLKPANVLFLDEHWCLADFGIARYAGASTQPDTWKMTMSRPYAAPERWRHERATSATDVYSFGVMAWETLIGHCPFPGPGWEDYCEQHLHGNPPRLDDAPPALASLILECLRKAPGARPSPKSLPTRLLHLSGPSSPGASRLRAANRDAVVQESQADAAASSAASEAQRRKLLFDAANRSLQEISARMRMAIEHNAPAAKPDPRSPADDWALRLGDASIGMDPAKPISQDSFGRWAPAFDIIAVAAIGINIPPGHDNYHGRSHSLWYGDMQDAGTYRWFEMGFRASSWIARSTKHVPAAMEPNEDSGKAFANGITEWSLARPVVPIDQGEDDAFIERWLNWFGEAVDGELRHPRGLPEGQPHGTYRQS